MTKKEAEDLLWRYYYPICLKASWGYIRDDEDARDMALNMFEHWRKALLQYNEDKAKLVTYFDTVTKNFFIKFKRLHLDTRPNIVYSGQTDDDEDEQDIGLDVRSVFSDLYDYPYDGMQEGPEVALMEQERIEDIRAGLFPADRNVFDLLIEGYTPEEIAGTLNKSQSAVETSFRRIRELCRE